MISSPSASSRKPDGSYIVEGAVPLRDLNRALTGVLPDEEATTIAGLVIHEARMIPEVGQVFNFHGFRLEVLKKAQAPADVGKADPGKLRLVWFGADASIASACTRSFSSCAKTWLIMRCCSTRDLPLNAAATILTRKWLSPSGRPRMALMLVGFINHLQRNRRKCRLQLGFQ